jgi:general secretion pathway protein C
MDEQLRESARQDMINKTNWTDFSSVDGGNMLATVNRALPPWISLLLVIAIGWQIANIVWSLVPGTSAGDTVQAPASMPVATSGGGTRADVQAIADNHVFGEADAEAAPVVIPVVDDNLSDTRLTNLVLKGTIASAIPDFSVAVIADGTSEQRVYAIGDSIGSGATLHAVYSDRVVLNENGALTNLRLPMDYPQGSSAPVRRATVTTRQTTSNSLQNVVAENLTQISDIIRPTQYRGADGELAGFRVYPGRNRQKFAALGLRPGDLVKDINGQPLNDPTQAMQVFQSLGETEEVTVTIERNGQEQSLVLNTSQLDLDEESTQ